MALGGAGKKPDLATHNILKTASNLLFALDFDEAGRKAFQFWRSTYPTLRAWPVPIEKSEGTVGSPYIHATSNNIVQAFRKAEEIAPCVLFVDEIL
jgi:hypothetical protein